MISYPPTLDVIKRNNSSIRKNEVRSILLLYEEKVIYIGDFCIRFGKLKYFRSFFNNTVVDINFVKKENAKFYSGLLMNNPHLGEVTTQSWEDIPFDSYDIIFCIAYDEGKLLDHLQEKYEDRMASGLFRTAVFSISEIMLGPSDAAKQVFPIYEELIQYVRIPRPGELYLSGEEQEWGDRWLESNGIKPNEHLVIMLDSSSRKSKLINISVYFEFLSFILGLQDVKVLIFDERDVGKQSFYTEWLGYPKADKLIFSKGLHLREDLSIIGSSYTKMIFGPCTGLMHCASSIFNQYINSARRPADKLPLMVTYTGEYLPTENNADFWWGSSPLVNCLLLREKNGRKELTELNDLTQEEKGVDTQIPCSYYTSSMFIDFVSRKLNIR